MALPVVPPAPAPPPQPRPLPPQPPPQPHHPRQAHPPPPPRQPQQALVREWRAPFPISVRLTLSVHGRGTGDPTYRVDAAGAVWRTSLTPEGPATLRVLPERGLDIAAAAWGPGAAWLLDTLPEVLGATDQREGFDPGPHPMVRELATRHAGLSIRRS